MKMTVKVDDDWSGFTAPLDLQPIPRALRHTFLLDQDDDDEGPYAYLQALEAPLTKPGTPDPPAPKRRGNVSSPEDPIIPRETAAHSLGDAPHGYPGAGHLLISQRGSKRRRQQGIVDAVAGSHDHFLAKNAHDLPDQGADAGGLVLRGSAGNGDDDEAYMPIFGRDDEVDTAARSVRGVAHGKRLPFCLVHRAGIGNLTALDLRSEGWMARSIYSGGILAAGKLSAL